MNICHPFKSLSQQTPKPRRRSSELRFNVAMSLDGCIAGPGPWGDDPWMGWWGDEPPFHNPVFVITHHDREPVEMKGGTTFHFVTDGIESALAQAKEAAGSKDVSLGGGASVGQQYL